EAHITPLSFYLLPRHFLVECPLFFLIRARRPPTPTLFPYTTLFRSSPASRRRTPRASGAASTSICVEPWRPPCSVMRPRCATPRSEEHTSELQSRFDLVCRLLLEKKKKQPTAHHIT